MPYLQEFLLIASIHFLAVASPGPDFAIVLKQSIRYGRRIAIFTSIGIGAGILLHVAYSLIGIGLIIASDARLFALLKYIAASYFCYLAWHGLKAKAQPVDCGIDHASTEQLPSQRKAFITGFLINGLNVKATLFFVSLFSMVISPLTPFEMKLSYGIYMAVATTLWFSFLSYLLSVARVRRLLLSKGFWLDRLMGCVLLILAVKLVLSEMPA